MRKQKRNALVAMLACVGSVCFGLATNAFVAKADAATCFENVEIKMVEGAYVRAVDEQTSGLRFVSYMDATTYNYLESHENYDVSYGMLIAPVDYVNEFVVSEETVFGNEMQQKYYFKGYTGDTTDKKEIINLAYDTLTVPTDEIKAVIGDDKMCFKGVISKLHEENYTRKFVGVGYVKAVSKTDDSVVDYLFVSTTNQAESARSIATISQEALKNNAVTTGTVQETVLKKYAEKAIQKFALGEVVRERDGVYDDTCLENVDNDPIDNVQDYVISNVQGDDVAVTINGAECTAFTYENGTLTVKQENFAKNGVYNVSVTTTTGMATIEQYTATVETVDYVLRTAEEFDDWYHPISNTTNKAFPRYAEAMAVALTADIDVRTATLNQAGKYNTTFKGTFDGKGHVISNFSGKSGYGFIPYLTGTLKNLAMVNMTVSVKTAGFLGNYFCGTLENCYFQGTHLGGENANSSRQTGLYSAYTNALSAADVTDVADKISNVVVDVYKQEVAKETNALYGFATHPNVEKVVKNVGTTTIKNLYMVYNGMNDNTTNGGLTQMISPFFQNNHFYKTVADMQAEVTAVPAQFDKNQWTMYNGMLMMNSAADYYKTQSTTLTVSNTETEIAVGTALTVQSNMPWLSATLTVDGEPVETTAYTLVGNVLTVTDASLAGKTVTVEFQALAGGCAATNVVTKTFTIAAAVES